MAASKDQLTDRERAIYHRHLLLQDVGPAGQLKLLQSRVLIVGLGGLGSPALYYLAACGIGEIGIADSDPVELSNLQRQILHGVEDVGREKTLSARQAVARIRPDLRLNLYPFRISSRNAPDLIAPYDFIIEATDNFESKFLINDVCVKLGKPFSHAGILGTFGQTMTVIPGAGPCFRCVFEEVPAPGAVPTTEEVGVLGCVPGVMGAIQATEAIKTLLNLGNPLVGRLLTWDALAMSFREIKLPPERRCRVCAPS
jgi:molybdopterin-synthase adenylyltransferase